MALRMFSSLMRDFEAGAVGVNATASVGVGLSVSTVEVGADVDSALTTRPEALRLWDILVILHEGLWVLEVTFVDTGDNSWHWAGRHCIMVLNCLTTQYYKSCTSNYRWGNKTLSTFNLSCSRNFCQRFTRTGKNHLKPTYRLKIDSASTVFVLIKSRRCKNRSINQ